MTDSSQPRPDAPDSSRGKSGFWSDQIPYWMGDPVALLGWVAAGTSISSLLLYMAGVLPLREAGLTVLVPGLVVLGGCWMVALRREDGGLAGRLARGCWAGLLATFLYDIVRVPVVISGVPVFKAISYFGTVFVQVPAPTIVSECVGWSYHLSNGIGFALMYFLWVRTPRWWTAVIWGLVLEGVMLLTPYAEVFGYKLSRQFLAITIGSHVVYGLGLWMGWRWLEPGTGGGGGRSVGRKWMLASWILLPLGLAVIAADFHRRHAARIPASPPPYIGPHLYTTWDVLEPDRAAALWVWSRFVDREARFHFIPAFSVIAHGKPFDVPEAEVRRMGTRSATEVLLDQRGLTGDANLKLLATATHLYEITPWLLGTDPLATELGARIQEIERSNPDVPPAGRAALLFEWLDSWYAGTIPIPIRDEE